MAPTRQYDFVTGVESSTLPTAADPVADEDVVNKGYADETYARRASWFDSKQTITDIKNISATDRVDRQLVFCDDLNAVFKFDAASVAVNDDVTILQPTTGTGRWLAITGSASAVTQLDFKLNGDLSLIRDQLPFKVIDGAFVSAATTYSSHALFQEVGGDAGTLEVDVRQYQSPNTQITEIAHQFTSGISSISRAGSSINTQSIALATPQVNTQSITFYKTAISINSIILMPGGKSRYNLASAPDADYRVGDYLFVTGATSGANNGIFLIKGVNQDSGNNITVLNGAAVAQTGAAGTVNLQAFKYNLTASANAHFAVGEKALFAAHTSSANDGSFTIIATNSGGNNIAVRNPVGVTQGGVAGTIDTYRWAYTYTASVGADYVVGENAFLAAHTSSANDGNLPIKAVNSGGNNLIIYNEAGVAQGGIAGTADTNRWIYALGSNPASSFNVGEFFFVEGATAAANNGTFDVRQINRTAPSNLVAYNESGAAQGAVGDVYSTRKLYKFASDQSAIYTTSSRVDVKNCPTTKHNGTFDVVEVNRGGGANFNIVVEIDDTSATQSSPAGQVAVESKSLFTTPPTITSIDDIQKSSNGSFGANATVASGKMISMEILQVQDGHPENITIQLK